MSNSAVLSPFRRVAHTASYPPPRLLPPVPDRRPRLPAPGVDERSDSKSLIGGLNEAYRSLQSAYGEASALATTTQQVTRWRDLSQRLRHLRLSIDDNDLYLVVTASAAMTAERRIVSSEIDGLVADRY